MRKLVILMVMGIFLNGCVGVKGLNILKDDWVAGGVLLVAYGIEKTFFDDSNETSTEINGSSVLQQVVGFE